jgi:hypothetical protein
VVAPVVLPIASALPLCRLGLGVWSYCGGGEPRVLSPWPPLPLIVLCDRANQPSNGLDDPDPDASQGPNELFGPLVERSI